ncbi:PilZ domain-containing protein [Alkaliphilus peptidifermentans]|uniref:PilZ domain-containing protein n=1 Tax=Alkaliphilus peptidifermentans DSM 18978 TaxID=1120976 RepID=A0A1G5BM22_9FIRM|nr:PilZ domain-containing protein [Alkaliphilus peptidifermentans]SCX90960.1 PilZ domain-containing protein [Alkaliphilus peptidifermentans DSM 18978]
MHKGDTLIFYKEDETYYGTITHKEQEKVVFQSKFIDKLENQETMQFHLLSPVYGVVTGESKVYKLESPFEDIAVIQVINNSTQKRKDIRVETDLAGKIIDFTEIKTGNIVITNQDITIKNLSQNGLCLESNQHFPVGTILHIKISLFDSPINIYTKIIRGKKNTNSYEMGCILVNTPQYTKGIIGKYVLAKLKDEFAILKK